ncbi:MAG: ATP-binding protein [Pseudomonadota bacterium]|nr:ATP-binding protein [Pseudomonadota bacterium]
MQKSSSLAFGAKTYYRPIEAAIRWCGLLRFEQRILESLGQRAMPEPGEYPRWPLLHLYAERIFDGLTHGELVCGKTGIVLDVQRPALNYAQLIVRHVDLKAWISHYYPGERPGFLFDDIERAVHPAVSVETLNILLADREATKLQFAELVQLHEALQAAHDVLAKEQAARGGANNTSREPGLRSETTYLNIIGGLLTLLLGKSPSGTAYSSFHSMDAVVSALVAHHEGQPGLSERTLWNKLAQARRHLEASR